MYPYKTEESIYDAIKEAGKAAQSASNSEASRLGTGENVAAFLGYVKLCVIKQKKGDCRTTQLGLFFVSLV